MYADQIPPGGEGTISLTVKVGSDSGQFRHGVMLVTDDPDLLQVELVVTANVQAEVGVVPNFLQFWGKRTAKAQVKLKNYTNSPVKLSEVCSSNKYVKISVSSMTIFVNGEVVVIGELFPDVPEGVLSGWVTMRSNLESMPIIRIRIAGRIIGRN